MRPSQLTAPVQRITALMLCVTISMSGRHHDELPLNLEVVGFPRST